jgi:MFS family permease
MMGFSVIFPIFPETLKFFLSRGDDPTLKFFLGLLGYVSVPENNPLFIVLFGGILGGIYSVLQFIFAPIWGKTSDFRGRKPVLIFTSLGTVLGYIAWFLAGNFTLFVISRIITGAMGGNISVASAAIADSTGDKDRAKGMGMIGAGIGLGFLFGPPIGGILSGFDLIKHLPVLGEIGVTVFSSTALLALFIAFVNLILVVSFFTETLSSDKRNNSEKDIHPLLGIFKSNTNGLIYLSIIYFIFTFAFSGFEFGINFFLNGEFQFTPREIGYSFVYLGMIIIIVQGGIIRRISGKIKESLIALVGSISLSIGFLVLYFSHSILITFIALSFLAFGSAFLNPALSTLVSLISSQNEQGKSLGIMRGFGALGRAISPFAFGWIYFHFSAYATFLVSLVFSVTVILMVVIRDKNKK